MNESGSKRIGLTKRGQRTGVVPFAPEGEPSSRERLGVDRLGPQIARRAQDQEDDGNDGAAAHGATLR